MQHCSLPQLTQIVKILNNQMNSLQWLEEKAMVLEV
jgi:hypothetical protein